MLVANTNTNPTYPIKPNIKPGPVALTWSIYALQAADAYDA